MGKSMRGVEPQEHKVRSANDEWKSRWSAWVFRSLAVAVGFHAIVLILWPAYEIHRTLPEPRLEMVHLNPVATYGGSPETGQGTVASIPDVDGDDFALDEGGTEGTEEEIGHLLDELFGARNGNGTQALVPTLASATPDVRTMERDLILERLFAITPSVTSSTGNVLWPRIRNPSMIIRFLRNRYNPVYDGPGAIGFVSVAMSIDERGSVEWAQVMESSGHPSLDAIALSLFNEVVAFSPARSQGAAIPVTVVISVPFNLPW